MNKLVSFLEKKGIIATILGMVFAFPVNAKLCYAFYKSIDMTKDQLTTAAVMNLIAMFWFMLPSIIELKAGNIQFTIKD